MATAVCTTTRKTISAGMYVTAGILAAVAAMNASSAVAVEYSVTTASMREDVTDLANRARADKGCAPLILNAKLTKAAQRHADDMEDQKYFSHTSASGTTWDKRIRNAGYKRPAGENIAYGYDDPASVHEGWMNSPGHRRNIMDCKFKYVGVGHDNGYWVQDFGY